MTTPANESMLPTKLCHIVKRPDFDGYGFNLHSEKAKPGQFIGKVDANSPAEASGLKEGDRIVEVNGVAISGETHKQVVQRIKAMASEVRLLLLDVDGKGDSRQAKEDQETKNPRSQATVNGQQQQQQQQLETQGNAKVQMMPGASDNINSISIVSTKRMVAEESAHTANNQSPSPSLSPATKNGASSRELSSQMTTVTPPSSATCALNNNNSNSSSQSTASMMASTNGSARTPPTSTDTTDASNGAGKTNGSLRAGSLQLPMTAAEMRAKLLAKKKYDPKNESVDLKKKYEIVQKL